MEDDLPKGDFNCDELNVAKAEAERFLQGLKAVESVKNNPDFAQAPLARIEGAIKEGEGKVRRLPTQEELELASALNVLWDPETDEGWQAFPKALQEALQGVLIRARETESLYLETQIGRYEEGLAKIRTEIEKCPRKRTTLFASMTEEETADYSWKST